VGGPSTSVLFAKHNSANLKIDLDLLTGIKSSLADRKMFCHDSRSGRSFRHFHGILPAPRSRKNLILIFMLMVDVMRLNFCLPLSQSEDTDLSLSSSPELRQRFQLSAPEIAAPSRQVGCINLSFRFLGLNIPAGSSSTSILQFFPPCARRPRDRRTVAAGRIHQCVTM
jgi:hypothetical protein